MANGIGNRLRARLARPYPLWRGAWPETRFAVAATALVTAIVYVSRPFGLAAVPDPAAGALIAELGGACLVVSLLLRVAAPALLARRWDESRWTVGRQVAWEVVEVAVVAGALMAVLAWNGRIEISATRARTFVAITALCAVAPVVVRTLLMERWLRRRNEARAAQLADTQLADTQLADTQLADTQLPDTQETAPRDAPPSRLVRGRDGAVELAAGELRYVHAEENYVDVVFIRDGERSHRLLRVTLSGVERQFSDGSLVRCHRSYLVALAAIAGVRGNAQGFRLALRDLPETVPVSRSRAQAVLGLIGRRAAATRAAEPAPAEPSESTDTDNATSS